MAKLGDKIGPDLDDVFGVSAMCETVSEALARWDAGHSVFTVERGGFGPGYEQAIQILVIETCRKYVDLELPDWEDFQKDDEVVHRIDKACRGFSGAQVGAAKVLAYKYLQDGWAKTVRSVSDDMHIQVSNVWPTAEKTEA